MSPSIGIRVSVIIVLSSLLNCCAISKADECLKFDDSICGCKFNNGSIIDLRPISPEGKPLFKDIKATGPSNDTSEYSYNPCFEFREGDSGCKDGVTVCQKHDNAEYPVGYARNAELLYEEESKQLILTYKAKDRITNVTLICLRGAKKPLFEALGEDVPGKSLHYYMKLVTECACPDGCHQERSGLSTGSVLVVLFFVFSAVYFFGGMLYLRIVRGASGTEVLPNYDFWVDFPLLVRDGVVFLLNCCKAETTYERI